MEITNEKMPSFIKSARGRPNFYPFHELLPGQTLKVPIPELKDKVSALRNVSNALSAYRRRNNLDWKVACRTGENTINVHRLK